MHWRAAPFAAAVLFMAVLQACAEPLLPAGSQESVAPPPSSPTRWIEPTLVAPTPAPTLVPIATPTPVPTEKAQLQAFLDEATFLYRYGGGGQYEASYKDDVLEGLGLTFQVNGSGRARSGVVLEPVRFYELPPFTADDDAVPTTWHATPESPAGATVSWRYEITIRDVEAARDLGVIIARRTSDAREPAFEFARMAWFPDDVYIKPD